jgi:ammonium transporter Rh
VDESPFANHTEIGAPRARRVAAHLQRYNYLIGITLMMLVGFGYLMTFLRWYGMGAVGLTMMITCVGMLFAIAVEPFFKEGGVSATHKIPIDLTALIDGDFAVATFLISFGGLIGKVGPQQLLVLILFETFFYCANKQLLLIRLLDVADAGGTISM